MIIFLLIFAFNVATRPLFPLGTASADSETTYLYEVVFPSSAANPASTASRTIVASASGWVELFNTSTGIECRFIDSTEGECFGKTTGTATGTPSPVVLEVASTTTTSAARTTPTSASSTTTTQAATMRTTTPIQTTVVIVPTAANISNDFQNSPKASLGTIVGSTIAGVAAIAAVVVFILWRRRKRSRHHELLVEQFNLHPEDVMPRQTAGATHLPIQGGTYPTPNRMFVQPQSKRALANPPEQGNQGLQHQIIDVVNRLRQLEHHLVSVPPPLYHVN
ncbi:hypothetical protein BDP27DRAFT_1358349 [Rhodocollybia butyracea]|uniref:Uncharacterized protein n=1 Tax=Rhodocollybia butyracea TaxID=206335 RepID=A0A9P5UDZ8_9AGAR|nr:hypothetical protein BDP27DRAFT_1358349 [Rhodocollybia butyracea]